VTLASARIVEAVRGWQAAAPPPLVVAIDGHGAAGKTTLATAAAQTLGAVLLHTDDYLRGASATGDARPMVQDARPMAQYYDWARLRGEALEPALIGQAPLILVEGVSAAAPALADLVTRTVFVATPEPIRLERLHGRIKPEEWDVEWLEAERAYFLSRPPESFDLIVSGSTEGATEPRITG
jgi:uridine kinase